MHDWLYYPGLDKNADLVLQYYIAQDITLHMRHMILNTVCRNLNQGGVSSMMTFLDFSLDSGVQLSSQTGVVYNIVIKPGLRRRSAN